MQSCRLGEVTVTIPEGFQCEKERRLDVAKVCSTDVNPDLDTTADCTISVAYSGPPSTPADPSVLTEQMTGSGWSFTTTPLSDNGWRCPSVEDGTPYRCTLDTATARPGTDWSNFVSQLSFQIKVAGDFENCVAAKAADGLTDRACWSSCQPELTVAKTGPQSCPLGEPCTITYTVTNTDAALDFSGPITVGAMAGEALEPHSNSGPGVDLYAEGRLIQARFPRRRGTGKHRALCHRSVHPSGPRPERISPFAAGQAVLARAAAQNIAAPLAA